MNYDHTSYSRVDYLNGNLNGAYQLLLFLSFRKIGLEARLEAGNIRFSICNQSISQMLFNQVVPHRREMLESPVLHEIQDYCRLFCVYE